MDIETAMVVVESVVRFFGIMFGVFILLLWALFCIGVYFRKKIAGVLEAHKTIITIILIAFPCFLILLVWISLQLCNKFFAPNLIADTVARFT